MNSALATQHPNVKPKTVASAWVSERASVVVYAAYWFSHGVPLADQ